MLEFAIWKFTNLNVRSIFREKILGEFAVLYISTFRYKMSSQSNIALNNWLMANNVENISSVDEIYRYDRKQQQDMLAAKPWDKE